MFRRQPATASATRVSCVLIVFARAGRTATNSALAASLQYFGGTERRCRHRRRWRFLRNQLYHFLNVFYVLRNFCVESVQLWLLLEPVLHAPPWTWHKYGFPVPVPDTCLPLSLVVWEQKSPRSPASPRVDGSNGRRARLLFCAKVRKFACREDGKQKKGGDADNVACRLCYLLCGALGAFTEPRRA